MVVDRAFEKHLLRDGLIDEPTLLRAKSEAALKGAQLLDTLVQQGYASEEALYRSVASYCELRYVSASKITVPTVLLSRVPARFATHYHFVPVEERNGVVVVAVSDPLNHQLLDDIRLLLKQRIEPVVSSPEEIARAIKLHYGVGADTVERILGDSESVASAVSLDFGSVGSDLGDEKVDASIIKFVNELFAEAIQSGATDVHLEPFEEQLRVRFRVDGVLHQVATPPSIRGFQPAIVSRIKIMANLNIAEKRLPQDGKISASLGEQRFDLRVSILPTPYGETVNIRFLNRASMFLTLDQLGFVGPDLELFNSFLSRPHGMILVTGPTGSGKTTTLYAALHKLNRLDHKIITIEDPIEYQLSGITQMQVQPQIGFDFSKGLRSMLRHDPDIMMVGEIRDYETAEMAIRSSLTGHLVFSTLHTNDAAGAVTRLIDMGVEPFLIASTMIASMAQRLVRKVCDACAEPYTPDADLLEGFAPSAAALASATFRRGRGCDQCRHTGYKGRLAIYEILPFSSAIKELTIQRAPSTVIKRKGCDLGMTTLRQAGWLRAVEGVTTLDEVLRVAADADPAEETGLDHASVSV